MRLRDWLILLAASGAAAGMWTRIVAGDRSWDGDAVFLGAVLAMIVGPVGAWILVQRNADVGRAIGAVLGGVAGAGGLAALAVGGGLGEAPWLLMGARDDPTFAQVAIALPVAFLSGAVAGAIAGGEPLLDE